MAGAALVCAVRSSSPIRLKPKELPWSVSGSVFAGLALGMFAMTALHFVQPTLNPIDEPVSFYVHGAHGWLLPLALGSFGLACVGLARALSGLLAWRPRCMLALFGTGMFLTAFIPSDTWFPWEMKPSLSGLIHSTVATLAPVLLLDPMFAIARARHGQCGPGVRGCFIGYAAALVGSALSLAVGFALDVSPPRIGLAERLLALAALAWVALVALGVRRPAS